MNLRPELAISGDGDGCKKRERNNGQKQKQESCLYRATYTWNELGL